MDLVNDNRKVYIEILTVESIPCDVVGKSAVFDRSGRRLTEVWEFPWPMEWIEVSLREAVKKNSYVSQTLNLNAFNPDEPDQVIEFRLRSYIDLRVGDLPGILAEKQPERIAFINSSGCRKYTYGSLATDVDEISLGLIAIGVEKDDKTAVWAVNSPEYAIAQFGVAKVGSVMTPLNAYEKEHYIENALNQSHATTLILQVGTKSTENIEILYRICPELCDSQPGKLRSKRVPKLRNVIVKSDYEYPGTYRWSDILSIGAKENRDVLERRQKSLCIDDPVNMIFTSGTTGVPKGVLLSHGNIIENSHAMKTMMELNPSDVMCIQAPMFHCFGCIAGAVTGILGGCSMVMVDKFKSEFTLSLIRREKCTVVSGVPVMFSGLARAVEAESCPEGQLNIRTGIIAGAPTGLNFSKDIKDMLGIKKPIFSYGLTEASPCVSSSHVNGKQAMETGKVGKPIPGVRVKIADKGEIAVYGYNVMQGYYNDPNGTNKVIRDGWLFTGDRGYFDEEGNLYVMGRIKDIIIRNGENISPNEIECLMELYPGVQKVSVVGIPHDKNGEQVFAFVSLKPGEKVTEEGLKQYLKGRIAKYKIPSFISFVDSFPITATGKVEKYALREKAMIRRK